MTREEAYNDGWHEGRRWAERDILDGYPVDAACTEVREWAITEKATVVIRASALGVARGYRDTVARYEAGEYTKEMFDAVPPGPS